MVQSLEPETIFLSGVIARLRTVDVWPVKVLIHSLETVKYDL